MASVFKYLSEEMHARALIERGDLYFRTLAYFRSYDDGNVRGDAHDGKLYHQPEKGLNLTKADGSVVSLPRGWQFMASVHAEDIFVYCLSFEKSEALAQKFKSPFCVEIKSADVLFAKTKRSVRLRARLDRQIYGRPVEYRSPTVEVRGDWALPEKVAFVKPEAWRWQAEYRMVVGRRGAFAVENVDLALESGLPNPAVGTAGSPLILRVGDLSRIAQLHRF